MHFAHARELRSKADLMTLQRAHWCSIHVIHNDTRACSHNQLLPICSMTTHLAWLPAKFVLS